MYAHVRIFLIHFVRICLISTRLPIRADIFYGCPTCGPQVAEPHNSKLNYVGSRSILATLFYDNTESIVAQEFTTQHQAKAMAAPH